MVVTFFILNFSQIVNVLNIVSEDSYSFLIFDENVDGKDLSINVDNKNVNSIDRMAAIQALIDYLDNQIVFVSNCYKSFFIFII